MICSYRKPAQRDREKGERCGPVPSPDRIRELTAKIRRGWTPGVEASRRLGHSKWVDLAVIYTSDLCPNDDSRCCKR